MKIIESVKAALMGRGSTPVQHGRLLLESSSLKQFKTGGAITIL
jgi:hypothetical protein